MLSTRRSYRLLNSKLALALATSTVVAVVSLPASGAFIQNSYTVAPETLNNGSGFYSDGAIPLGSQTHGTVGGNSFESAVDGSGGTRPYSGVIITPAAIGMTGITVNQLTGLTFDTQKVGGDTSTSAATDWSAKIYTVPQPGDPTNFYSARIDFNPASTADQPSFISNDINTLSVFGVKQAGANEVYGGTYTSAKATAAESNTASTIGNEQIEYIELIAGSQTPGPAIDSYLDNVVATETLSPGVGVVSSVDLVPEPAALSIMSGAMVLMLRRPKRRQT